MGRHDSLGDRMKTFYEERTNISLLRRMPVIIRLDGRAFHTLTNSCKKPFDIEFAQYMDDTAEFLCREMQGAKCAYVQSDEISLLLTDFDTLITQAWFDNDIQKMVSISAGLASVRFTLNFDKVGIFDSRAFNIPKEEVANYFVWRQKDWFRNSLNMLAQCYFTVSELHGKSQEDLHEMLHKKNIYWGNENPRFKNGCFIYESENGWNSSNDIIFTKNRESIEQYLKEGVNEKVSTGIDSDDSC